MKEPERQDICNENFFSAFFKEHARSLRNFIYFRFGDPQLAEDITQDTFIKLWEKCAEVRSPKSFIYTVAKNSAINLVTHQKLVFSYTDQTPEKNTDYQSPEYIMEEEEFRIKFEKAIADLTEAQRTALLLNRIEGKKYKEIAEMLGITVKAVEKRIHGALIALSEKIENFR